MEQNLVHLLNLGVILDILCSEIISQLACQMEQWQNYHVNCILNKKAVPTICFSCDGMSSPEYCDKVEHCQPNQICYTESYQTDYGKVFRSGCMDEQKCHKEENSTSNSVCVECCTNEMCNNKGCGNADFPPREHRGPMCFDCQHIGDISSCRKVTMCASDQ
ncbi:uncharacterized protein LOC132738747, partial [Ruditapes philippinarum]|uniref:uncharacterized protein LOC132738747 n=1 Tax=Ruditapes philippinarum TaxID=129788 RepID=UPI00295C02A3